MVYHSWLQHSELVLHGYDSILVLASETDCKYVRVSCVVSVCVLYKVIHVCNNV